MKKKTKIIVLVAMIVLLGVTGYLNIMLNNRIIDAGANTQYANFFDAYRSYRTDARAQEKAMFEAIIASETSSSEAKTKAENDYLELIAQIEDEVTIEGLILAKGFADVIVTNTTNFINVIVKATELTSAEVAQIVSVVQEQTGSSIDYITVIPSG